MKITGREQQKRDKNGYNFLVDREYVYALFDETTLKYGLRKGDVLDDRKIREMKEYDDYNYGKRVAYNYLAYRQRSRKEIERKLKTKQISVKVTEKVIKWLEDLK